MTGFDSSHSIPQVRQCQVLSLKWGTPFQAGSSIRGTECWVRPANRAPLSIVRRVCVKPIKAQTQSERSYARLTGARTSVHPPGGG